MEFSPVLVNRDLLKRVIEGKANRVEKKMVIYFLKTRENWREEYHKMTDKLIGDAIKVG